DKYQLYGSITTIFGEQINEKIIKFKAENIFGFSVIVENISDEKLGCGKMNINWMLVGNPEEIIYKDVDLYDLNFIVVNTSSIDIEFNKSQNWDINLPISSIFSKLPKNAVFAYTFKYPTSDNKSLFTTFIKSVDEKGDDYNNDDIDDEYSEYKIYWCVYLTSVQNIMIGQFLYNINMISTLPSTISRSGSFFGDTAKSHLYASHSSGFFGGTVIDRPPASHLGSFFGGTAKNRPPASAYIKSSKSISFSYAGDNTSFQLGILGDSDSYLVGTLHLNYGKQHQVRNISLNFKGTEKTMWYKALTRKVLYTGEQIVVDHSQEIWRSDDKNILNLDVPFKIKLPYNLPESIITELGTVNYVLQATINRKGGLMSSSTQIVEIQCPLKRTLTLDNSNLTPYKLRGESRSGVDYSFTLPPNKNFNLGTYVTIPIRMKFVRPGVSVERIELALNCCMDFRCSNPNETRHVKENVVSLAIPCQEIRAPNLDGEYTHIVNLFIPRSVQPTYSGRFVSITHQFYIKFCLWGANDDFQVEESVRSFITSHSYTSPPQQPSPAAMVRPSSLYSDAYPEDIDYKLNLHNPPQVHALNTSPYIYNSKDGQDDYTDLYPPGLALALNANDLWYRQQLAALHHQQQLYNKKSQMNPIPGPPVVNHSRHTSNSSYLNTIMINDNVRSPSPSIPPSKLNPSNNSLPKLPSYAESEHVYSRRSPIIIEKNQTPQQKMDNISKRKEHKLDINLDPSPQESSPSSYREHSTSPPEDIYTRK
ncbi:12392_t:CDS:2, partial [Gigaspora margarita]